MTAGDTHIVADGVLPHPLQLAAGLHAAKDLLDARHQRAVPLVQEVVQRDVLERRLD